MNLRSPVVAMLWEHWRLTRVEAAQRLGFGLVLAIGAMALFRDQGAHIAFVILISTSAMFWFSIAKLNGGQFMDGYKPGFPLYLLYTRPVSTPSFVIVAMAYDALSCLVLYLVSATFIGTLFGRSLPLFSVGLWIVGGHLCYLAIQWSTRNRIIQWIGAIAFSLLFFYLIKVNVENPLRVAFSLAENLLMLAICVVSIVVTVVGVSHQRSGNAVETVRRQARSSGYPDWLITPFQFACPTSSPTRAQIWFELKSSGLPIVSIGLILAVIVALLFAFSIPFPRLREYAVGLPLVFGPLFLLFMGANAFGIRRKQGRAYLSAFEAAQPYAVAPMAALKILVRSACIMVAAVIVGASEWLSSSLVYHWAGWMVEGKAVTPKLLQMREAVAFTFGGQPSLAYLMLAAISFIAIVALIAVCATYSALRLRYGRRPVVAIALLPIWFLATILMGIALRSGAISKETMTVYLASSACAFAAVMLLATGYMLWTGFRDRALTIGYVSGAVLVSIAMVLACLPSDSIFTLLLPGLIPLIPAIAAPWSLGRVRHT